MSRPQKVRRRGPFQQAPRPLPFRSYAIRRLPTASDRSARYLLSNSLANTKSSAATSSSRWFAQPLVVALSGLSNDNCGLLRTDLADAERVIAIGVRNTRR